jgi:hypothetical protein
MNIHVIRTGTVAIHPNQSQGKGQGYARLINVFTDRLPIYAWVIEHPDGVIVVDTSETARTAEPGYFPAWHPYFKHAKAAVTADQEIGPQPQALGTIPMMCAEW